MEEKKKQRQILSWVAIVLIFWTLLFVLVGNYISAAKKEAVVTAEENFKNDVYTWASQVNSIIQTARAMGSLFGEDGLTADENLILAQRAVENTAVEHIYQVKDGQIYIDETGIIEPVKFSMDLAGVEYLLVDNFMLGNDESTRKDSFFAVIPVKNDEYILIQVYEEYIETHCFEDARREVSFLSVADRNGDIYITFDSFRDRTSSFFTNLNFLNNITETKNSDDSVGRFKTCYVNGIDAAIRTEYKNDERIIVTSPIGTTGYSLIYGVRNSYAETYIESYYAKSKNTMIRILIVVMIFSAFIVTIFLLAAFKNKERGRELETKADTDLLTDLYNKLATERRIKEYIESSPEGRGLMFILDIDNFKKINDTMGHAFGDTLLRTLGKEIKAEFRSSDIIGRTGGDEFIVFLKGLNDDTTIEREANRLVRFFQDFKAGGDYVKYSATASIGAAIYPDDADNFKDLYVAADKALYKAKKHGKNQLCFYRDK